MISDVLHSSMYQLAIWTSSLEKYLFRSSAYFIIRLFSFIFAFGVSSKKSLLRQIKELICLYFFPWKFFCFRSSSKPPILLSYFFFLMMRQGSSFILLQASLTAQVGKESTCWFDSWIGKIHWRKDRLPTAIFLGFTCGSGGKESACNVGDLGSIPGLRRSPGEWKGYPLPYSGLENSMNSIVHGVAKSWTQLSNFHFHSSICIFFII